MEVKKRTIFEIFGDDSELDNIQAHSKQPELGCVDSPQHMERNKKTIHEIILISVNKLEPYPGHIFKPYSDDKLRELADDIEMNGVISPIIVRPIADKFQILSGHNRTNAAKLAGLTEVPCIIKKDFDDDTAALIVVNTNLNQRENLLPSEKAYAYKTQVELLKKRGKIQENFGQKSYDSEENQEHSALRTGNDSRTNIYLFIRLTHLIDELLQSVDIGNLAVAAGAELSHIDHIGQSSIYQYFFMDRRGVLDIKTAKLLHQRARAVDLTLVEIEKLLQKTKKADSTKAQNISLKSFKRHIPLGTPKKEAEETINKALDYYFENYKGD